MTRHPGSAAPALAPAFRALLRCPVTGEELVDAVDPDGVPVLLSRKYRGYINIIGNARNKLEYKKARNSVRSKP